MYKRHYNESLLCKLKSHSWWRVSAMFERRLDHDVECRFIAQNFRASWSFWNQRVPIGAHPRHRSHSAPTITITRAIVISDNTTVIVKYREKEDERSGMRLASWPPTRWTSGSSRASLTTTVWNKNRSKIIFTILLVLSLENGQLDNYPSLA